MKDKVLKTTWYHSDISVTHEVSMAEILYNKSDDSITCIPEISPSEIVGEGNSHFEALMDFIKKFEEFYFRMGNFYKYLLTLPELEHVWVDYSNDALPTQYQNKQLMNMLREKAGVKEHN